ncbi:benzaldehyde dehydrogenase [Sphaerisporangium siamense]|uniref:Benzaldehyde dehydrogenase (NAD) n=1 Tax=Sphaerisporangium siamense TaxID=795645 RepID=A0A7W7D6X5_9ACTN|nr:aldehyde dehydrogenase family protein [Sphaerisporangium siamense]MBB4701413.1 benzaldehyde dehydrogenase (NAD) [Sphaerisporangium siamense]GII85536.1 benzaldehyde dehydrogenase [Sphaerisporangium siamense]
MSQGVPASGCDFASASGLLYSGGWRPGGGGTAPVLEVATGERIGEIALADEADVERAGAAAAEAQRAWARASFRERSAVMARAGQALEGMRADIVAMMIRETGCIRAKAEQEITKAQDELRAAAELADQPYGQLLPHDDPAVLSMARRVPVGVVGVIAPWNAPLMLAIRSVAPALVLGNAVLLKPDVKTALSGGVALARVFEAAGLPDGLLHVLPGGPATGEAVVRSPHTSVISFTGSSATGRRVGELAGGLLKRVVLELGGNNAFIVLDDADLDAAVNNAAWGSLLHQGQICMATGRHLVHERIADEYVARLTEHARSLVMGDPKRPEVRVGPLIDARQAGRVHAIVTAAVEAGAVVGAGGTQEGPFYRPTVLDRVDPGSPAFTEEIFGPVIPVTRFGSDEEAAELANRTSYGLSAAVHTRDLARGLALADRLRTGMVHVNGQTINDAAHVPMGGMGASGNGGRYGGHWNLDEFTYWQWVTTRSTPPAYPV